MLISVGLETNGLL